MKVDMKEIAGTDILSGALAGRDVLGKLLAATASEPSKPEPLFLDFCEVTVATASFLRESVMQFRDFVRGGRSMFYPVIANANSAVREELLELLRGRGGAFLAATLADDGTAADIKLIGELDPKQRTTFDLVQKIGTTDAGQLMEDYKDQDVNHATAWNNRLSSLAKLGLVVEISEGRSKKYRPLFEGGTH